MNQQLTNAKRQNFSNPLISNASYRRKSSKGATRHYLTPWHWLVKKIQQTKAVHFTFPSH